jgi:hypothetical protein
MARIDLDGLLEVGHGAIEVLLLGQRKAAVAVGDGEASPGLLPLGDDGGAGGDAFVVGCGSGVAALAFR